MSIQEVWKDIEDYVGLYQVSSFGRVKSCDRYVYAGDNNHVYQHIKEKILRPGGSKYKQVILCKNGKIHAKTIHRLVAQAFIPNPDNLPCINHKDENPLNNYVDNLEWCTYQYNNKYNGRLDKCRDKISKTLTGRKSTHILTEEQRKHISDAAKRGWEKRKQRMQKKEEL